MSQLHGGTSAWDVEAYIAARCRAEGVADGGGVRPYTGPRIDWAPLDEFDEKRRARQRERAAAEAARAAATSEVSNNFIHSFTFTVVTPRAT